MASAVLTLAWAIAGGMRVRNPPRGLLITHEHAPKDRNRRQLRRDSSIGVLHRVVNEMTKERIEQLRALRVTLKSGEYDGAHIMAAWIALAEYADLLERQSSEPETPQFGQQAEAMLSAILGCIGRYGDELMVRRIWDEARRAALSSRTRAEHD